MDSFFTSAQGDPGRYYQCGSLIGFVIAGHPDGEGDIRTLNLKLEPLCPGAVRGFPTLEDEQDGLWGRRRRVLRPEQLVGQQEGAWHSLLLIGPVGTARRTACWFPGTRAIDRAMPAKVVIFEASIISEPDKVR